MKVKMLLKPLLFIILIIAVLNSKYLIESLQIRVFFNLILLIVAILLLAFSIFKDRMNYKKLLSEIGTTYRILIISSIIIAIIVTIILSIVFYS